MLKKIFLLFLFLSLNVFSMEINDKASILKEDEYNEIKSRFEIIEKNFNVKFNLNILEEENLEKNPEEQRTINLNIIKINSELKISIRFSEDMDMSSYAEDINSMLRGISKPVQRGYYYDIIYEISGNISDMLNLIDLEKKQEIKKKRKLMFKSIILVLIIIFNVFLFLIYLIYFYKKKIKKCRNCNIDMMLVNKSIKDNKEILTYKCSICGYTKKLIKNK